MNLPVIRTINYISPSALGMWNHCQHKFYLMRLAGYPFVQEPISEAAACGIVFEAFVIDYLAQKRNIKSPHINLNNTLKNISNGNFCIHDIIKRIRPVAQRYIELGLLDDILIHKKLYLQQELSMQVLKHYNNIVILGKLDMFTEKTIIDLKLRGFASDREYPLYKGYSKAYDSKGNLLPCSPVKLMEINNKRWAIQLWIYKWLVQQILNVTPQIIIHELVKTNDGFNIGVHHITVSEILQREVLTNLENLWDKTRNLEINIDRPEPSEFKCRAYGTLCPVAQHCIAFQNWFDSVNDDDTEDMKTYTEKI